MSGGFVRTKIVSRKVYPVSFGTIELKEKLVPRGAAGGFKRTTFIELKSGGQLLASADAAFTNNVHLPKDFTASRMIIYGSKIESVDSNSYTIVNIALDPALVTKPQFEEIANVLKGDAEMVANLLRKSSESEMMEMPVEAVVLWSSSLGSEINFEYRCAAKPEIKLSIFGGRVWCEFSTGFGAHNMSEVGAVKVDGAGQKRIQLDTDPRAQTLFGHPEAPRLEELLDRCQSSDGKTPRQLYQ